MNKGTNKLLPSCTDRCGISITGYSYSTVPIASAAALPFRPSNLDVSNNLHSKHWNTGSEKSHYDDNTAGVNMMERYGK